METRLSTRLKNLRKDLNLSSEEVIKKLKVNDFDYTTNSLYKWEEGLAIPNIHVIKTLAKIYHCQISYLIDEKNTNYKNLTANEVFVLRLFRNDFLFRSIAVQIIRKMQRHIIIK